MRRELMPLPDKNVLSPPGGLHDIVGNKTMPPFDEVQHALALANARAADKEQSHAIYIRQRAMQRRAWREGLFENRFHAPIEFGRLEMAQEQRHTRAASYVKQLGRYLLSLGDEHAGQVQPKQCLQAAKPGFGSERVEIGNLGLAKDVQALGGESAGVPREGKTGARDLAVLHDAVESGFSRQRLQLKWITLAGKQVAYAKVHAWSALARLRGL